MTPSIQMSGNINPTYIIRGCTFQSRNSVFGGGFIRRFWQANNALKFLWYMAQINCRWNNYHVICPRAVSWISVIVMVMEIFHGIFKCPHTDGYAVDYMCWNTDNTNHLVPLLPLIPLYCSTMTIAEKTEFLFYPEYFLL